MNLDSINFLNYVEAEAYLLNNPLPIDHIVAKYSKRNTEASFSLEPVFYGSKINKLGVIVGRDIYHSVLVQYFELVKGFKYVNQEPFVYNGAYYEKYDIGSIGQFLEEKILENNDLKGLSTVEINTFKINLTSRAKRLAGIDVFNINKGKYPLTNGVFNTNTMKLEAHSPDNFFTYRLPWSWNDEKSCPNWNKLMGLVFTEEVYREMFEWYVGWTLSQDGHQNFQYFLIMHGSGENGKSFLLDVVKKMIGSENYVTKKVSDLLSNTDFTSTSSLENKLALFADDEKEDCFQNTSLLKELTGGNESISVRRLYKESYQAKIIAKIFMTTNRLPYTPDTSDGFRRRILILPFFNKIKKHERIVDLDGNKSMFIPEFPSIITRCLKIYRKYKESGLPDFTPQQEELINRLCDKGNNLESWLNLNLVYVDNQDHKLSMESMYEMYDILYNKGKAKKKRQNFYEEVKQWVDIQKDMHYNKYGVYAKCSNIWRAGYEIGKRTVVHTYYDLKEEDVFSQSFFTNRYDYGHADYLAVSGTHRGVSQYILYGFLFKREAEELTEVVPF